MGVDVTHVIKNDFFECNDDKKAMEYSRKTIAKLKKILFLNDPDEEIDLHQEEWDGFTLTTFYLPLYDVQFSLHNGFWEIDSYCHYCQIVMHWKGYFHLRRVIYDIAKALDCTEAWHAIEHYTWNGDGEEIWNTNFDNWMEYLHKKLPEGIPEFDEVKILAQGDVHIPKHEELYHDSFKDCNLLYDRLIQELPEYKILGIAYAVGFGYLRCEKDGKLYLINEKTLQPLCGGPIDDAKYNMRGPNFTVKRNGLTALFDNDGNQLTEFVNGDFEYINVNANSKLHTDVKKFIINKKAGIRIEP